jgi:hypothetical protein
LIKCRWGETSSFGLDFFSELEFSLEVKLELGFIIFVMVMSSLIDEPNQYIE